MEPINIILTHAFWFFNFCCFSFSFEAFIKMYHVSVQMCVIPLKYSQVCLSGRHVQTKNPHDLKRPTLPI